MEQTPRTSRPSTRKVGHNGQETALSSPRPVPMLARLAGVAAALLLPSARASPHPYQSAALPVAERVREPVPHADALVDPDRALVPESEGDAERE